ncbi:IS4 family transposase [Cytophagaceae bacterium DM2B3-1]|uniref:IS4 family transposase n=1 Tax=Xanthocytophaga flava TaxID=3048013 RepID=A0ABT7CYF8_9BACT|nr:IS4 family transposase [Xanthocytophaga flavus]MDJ1498701.1 IS4 family transposase [Xanthocytophaga flavus]
MSLFKDHKVSVSEVLSFIPEALLSHLSTTTKVDYYAKVLHGKKMFYLLLYSILDNDRLSQRSLEDTFNYSGFKAIFNLDLSETVRRSSLSDRLSSIDPAYFKEIFDYIYDRFSEQYTQSEREKYHLMRVDSTLVAEAAIKLKEGIDQKSSKKLIKYSMCFDGILPADVQTFTSQIYSSEDNALPEAVFKQVQKEREQTTVQANQAETIYLIDRGLQSTRTIKEFTDRKIKFVIRLKQNRKYEQIHSLLKEGQDLDFGDTVLEEDSLVHLYTGVPIKNKQGNIHYKEEKVETPFRLVIVKKKTQTDKTDVEKTDVEKTDVEKTDVEKTDVEKTDQEKQFWFITNVFDLTAKQVADSYRRRWDIEVFFRFIKQELNVNHLVSLSKNGIQVIIYMSLIVAMLVLLYKKANNLGYKTAKRRFVLQLRELITAIMITLAGGDPNNVFKT